MKPKRKKDTLSRVNLAQEMRVALVTIDDWTRRGCPVLQSGARGRESKYSLSAVRAWRIYDLESRGQPIDPELLGLEHLNVLRSRIEDAGKHLFWFLFRAGTDILLEDFTEKGMSPQEARRAVGATYYILSIIFENWIVGDRYNKALQADHLGTLDHEFRRMVGSRYIGTSHPPANFDIDDLNVPEPIQKLFAEFVKAKRHKSG